MKIKTIKDLQSYGRAVKRARLRKGWTQEKVGAVCGVTGDMISKIERGDAGPKPQTLKRLEEGLGIPTKRFLDLGPGGEVMEGLQELTDQVRLLVQKFGNGQAPVNPVLPDASQAKGDKAQIINAVSSLQDRMDKYENGIKAPVPAEDETKTERETPDKVIDNLLRDQVDAKQGDFFKSFGGFWDGESKEQRRYKAQFYVDCCNVCNDLELDPFEEVKSGIFSGSANRAEAMRDALIEFDTDDISQDEARKELQKLLKPANPGDEDEDEELWG